jgi:hypothetical protein
LTPVSLFFFHPPTFCYFLVFFKIMQVALVFFFLSLLNLVLWRNFIFKLNLIDWFHVLTFIFLGVKLLHWAWIKNLMDCGFESLTRVYRIHAQASLVFCFFFKLFSFFIFQSLTFFLCFFLLVSPLNIKKI